MKAYQYDASGYFAGEVEDYGGPLPNNATRSAPQEQDGYIPRWNGAAWEQVEDHKGEEGYVNGQPHTIKNYGPLPEGWSQTPPQPSQAERDAIRRAEILARLAQIDAASVRPLRAIVHGEAVQEDRDKLAVLDAEAETLRAELATLPEPEIIH